MICADATYKLVDIRIPLYMILIEDSNGQSEISAYRVLINEQRDTLQGFFNKFKDCNPVCSNTRIFITNKDIKDRSVIKSFFQHSFLHSVDI